MDQDKVDPERPREPRPFNDDRGYSGQDYRERDERALGRDLPAGQVPPPGMEPSADGTPDPELPPDNGAHAAVDADTGEVRGSGVGSGGGQPGEDLEQDGAAGAVASRTGS